MASGSNSRSTKLKTLNELRRKCPHITASALSEVLSEIADTGLPELYGRGHIAEAAEQELSLHDSYGPLLSSHAAKAKDCSEDNIEIITVNPLSMLQAVFGQGGSYHKLLTATVAIHAVLSAIVYFDEVVPGDPLGYANRRKIWVCYLAFKEFGARILSNEAVWLPLLELRTSVTATLSGGISQVCKIILRSIFLNPACDAVNLGIQLKGPADDQIRFRIHLAYLLQDGAAHKYVFNTKGDAGTKMCLLCRNLVATSSDIFDDEGEMLCKPSLTYEHEMDMADDNDIAGTIARLKSKHDDHLARKLNATQFSAWEKACGLNFEPDGLMWDPDLMMTILSPTKHYVHDWMHTMFVTGVFQTVMWLMMVAIKDAFSQFSMKKLFDAWHDYLGLWTQPCDKSGDMQSNFTQQRLESMKRSKTFKCKASDGLGLYPIIALWLMYFILPTGKCHAECEAFLAMCDMIDLLIACSQEGHNITPVQLGEKIFKFLRKCVKADWKHRMHPKFHWLVHFPSHLANHGYLVACFVHERLHKLSKRYGTDIRNTRSYEVSLLTQVLCQVLHDVKEHGLFDVSVGLKKPRAATKKALAFLSHHIGFELDINNCKISKDARVRCGSCSRKDIVLISNPDHGFFECGEVWLHAEVMGSCISLVSMWSRVGYDKPKGLMQWQRNDNPMLIPTADIISAVTYRTLADNTVLTILPCHLR